jgi:hypothetical protein
MTYIQNLLKDIYTLCTTVSGGTNNIEIEEEILNTDESISTLSEQFSVAIDCPLFAQDPETTTRLVQVAKALENVVFSNTGESISTLSEQFPVTPDYLTLRLNELTMNPEVSESLVRVAEILDQVPPIV